MFAPFIKNNLKFINDYFSLLLNNNKSTFPQSIILYGEDIFAQYLLALNFGKILNCQNTSEFNCNCINCNWITTNSHPAVITVSKLDFKPDNDNSKTVISVKQTLALKNLLATTSEYHRIFIICDADIKTPNKNEKEKISILKSNNFSFPYEDEEHNKFWIPKGLNQKVFQEESANSLLKVIEEPPPRTSFIFLTKDKTDLIETIISRSQCFYVPSKYMQDNDLTIIFDTLKFYPEINPFEIGDIATTLINQSDTLNLEPEELFTKFQQFIKKTALNNTDNPTYVAKMLDDINTLNKAQMQLKSYIKPQAALENALFSIYKNWT